MIRQTLFALAIIPATFAQQRNFVACPIVRDTKTVPCFLAEHDGETYYLTIQQDIQAEIYPPQLLHEVLVEGTVAPGPRVCGGIPLKPVKLSVLPELNLACNVILPAEPGIDAPPTHRPAGPSTRQAPVTTAPPPPERFTAPFSERQWKLLFDFDSAYLNLRATRTVSQVAEFTRAAQAKSVEVAAQRASTLLSNGKTITEAEAVTAKRAAAVAELLKGLGVDANSIKIRTVASAAKPNGSTDADNRAVAIHVIP
jgi:outer membrane protein OmpA-like peptidoglycan-associated protein